MCGVVGVLDGYLLGSLFLKSLLHFRCFADRVIVVAEVDLLNCAGGCWVCGRVLAKWA